MMLPASDYRSKSESAAFSTATIVSSEQQRQLHRQARDTRHKCGGTMSILALTGLDLPVAVATAVIGGPDHHAARRHCRRRRVR
jgi:hypothetical protein